MAKNRTPDDEGGGGGGGGLLNSLRKAGRVAAGAFVELDPPVEEVAEPEEAPARSRRDPLAPGEDTASAPRAHRPRPTTTTASVETDASFEQIYHAGNLTPDDLAKVKQVDESLADLGDSDEVTQRKFVTMALKNFVKVAPEAMVEICNRQIEAIDGYLQIATDETAQKVDALELEIGTVEEESKAKIAELKRQIEATEREATEKVAATRASMEQVVTSSMALVQRSNAEKQRIQKRIAIIGAPAAAPAAKPK